MLAPFVHLRRINAALDEFYDTIIVLNSITAKSHFLLFVSRNLHINLYISILGHLHFCFTLYIASWIKNLCEAFL